MACIQVHFQSVNFLKCTADGKALLTGTTAGSLKVWLLQE